MLGHPPRSLAERLTEHFYRWEARGRGWQVWSYPVDLEPPFRPFRWELRAGAWAVVDDARRPTRLGALVARLLGRDARPPLADENLAEHDDEQPVAARQGEPSNLVTLTVALPQDAKVERDRATKLLIALSGTGQPASFELLGTRSTVAVQIAAVRPSPRARRSGGSLLPRGCDP